MPHVSNGSSAKLVPATEYVVCVLLVVGHVWNGSEPQIPIESFRHSLGFARTLGPLLPDRAVGPIVDFLQVSDQSCIHPGFDLSVFGAIRPGKEVADYAGFTRFLNDFSALQKSIGNGLVGDHMYFFTHGRQRNRRVGMVWGHDFDRVDAFFLI